MNMTSGEDPHRYDDILHLTRPRSFKHPPMAAADRAAQFGAFAALTGHEEAIEETARLTEEFVELGEEEKKDLDDKIKYIQRMLPENVEAQITHFIPDERKEGGRYVCRNYVIRKIDDYFGKIFTQEDVTIYYRYLSRIVIDGYNPQDL